MLEAISVSSKITNFMLYNEDLHLWDLDTTE